MSPDQQCFWLTQLSSKPRHCIQHKMQTRFRHNTDSGADDYDQPKLRHKFFDAFSSPVRAQAKYFPNGEIPPKQNMQTSFTSLEEHIRVREKFRWQLL